MKFIFLMTLALFNCALAPLYATGIKEPGAEKEEKEKEAEPRTGEEFILKKLDPELQVLVTRALGKTLIETLQNIKSLSEVDRQLRALVANQKDAISDYLRNTFTAEDIQQAFTNALENEETISIIAQFQKFGLVPEGAKELIFNAFYTNIDNISLVKKFFELKLVSATQPFILTIKGVAKSINPMHPLLTNINMRRTIDREDVKDLLRYLQSLGWDVNAEIQGDTPLYYAVGAANMGLFKFLLEIGADPTLPANKRAVDWAKKRDEEAAKPSRLGPLLARFKLPSWGDLIREYSKKE